MMTNLTAIDESIRRCTQFRGPVPNEQEVRRIATELITALHQGQLQHNDLKAIADCLETACRRTSKTVVV